MGWLETMLAINNSQAKITSDKLLGSKVEIGVYIPWDSNRKYDTSTVYQGFVTYPQHPDKSTVINVVKGLYYTTSDGLNFLDKGVKYDKQHNYVIPSGYVYNSFRDSVTTQSQLDTDSKGFNTFRGSHGSLFVGADLLAYKKYLKNNPSNDTNFGNSSNSTFVSVTRKVGIAAIITYAFPLIKKLL